MNTSSKIQMVVIAIFIGYIVYQGATIRQQDEDMIAVINAVSELPPTCIGLNI
jgi:hypothetical protein